MDKQGSSSEEEELRQEVEDLVVEGDVDWEED
jgi:hypothetical protein